MSQSRPEYSTRAEQLALEFAGPWKEASAIAAGKPGALPRNSLRDYVFY